MDGYISGKKLRTNKTNLIWKKCRKKHILHFFLPRKNAKKLKWSEKFPVPVKRICQLVYASLLTIYWVYGVHFPFQKYNRSYWMKERKKCENKLNWWMMVLSWGIHRFGNARSFKEYWNNDTRTQTYFMSIWMHKKCWGKKKKIYFNIIKKKINKFQFSSIIESIDLSISSFIKTSLLVDT